MTDILQTVRTLTDMGIARQAIADVEFAVDVLEQLEFEPGCELEDHQASLFGHNANESAAWVIESPCGHDALSCPSFATVLISGRYKQWSCTKCGGVHDYTEFRFIPLTQTGKP